MMLQLINKTSMPGVLVAGIDHQDRPIVTVVVKATCVLAGPPPAVAEPIHFAAVPWDKAEGSAKRPSDVAPAAKGTDVLVCDEAVMRRPTSEQIATIALKDAELRLRLRGPRQWEKGLLRWGATDAKPFTRLALRWENAVGGIDAKGRRCAENPVGLGWANPIEGGSLPCIEDPSAPFDRPGDRPAPACCAAVAADWQPRLAHAGTYDAAWKESRAPLLPKDFDSRFHRQAPGTLALARHLAPGEQVRLDGFTAEPLAPFVIPAVTPQIILRIAGRDRNVTPTLDQLVFLPGVGLATLTWRYTLAIEATALQVAWVVMPKGSS